MAAADQVDVELSLFLSVMSSAFPKIEDKVSDAKHVVKDRFPVKSSHGLP